MIFEHEIPTGSKLYFGKTAKLKRSLENQISEILANDGYEEIVTPIFSYYQHQSIEDETKLIKIADEANNQITLRADSTLDAVRIITKRLGRTTNHRKWFYVQPVFSYPNEEQNQIGCEWIEHDQVCDVVDLAVKIVNQLQIEPVLQISNINITKIISKQLKVDERIFQKGEVDKLFDMKLEWLDTLLWANSIEDLENAKPKLPNFLKSEIEKLIDVASKIQYSNLVVAPLYHSSLKYYEDIYFRFFEANEIIIKGGRYLSKNQNTENINSLGFAIYTDTLINFLEESK